jgi:quinol monooxygenase YgiN
MIVYEVDIEVEAACAADYRRWLHGHVAAMLALPGFTGAEVFEVVTSPPDPGHLGLCVHYRLRDEAALDDYLREHAARMRADAVARFGDRFQATRRVLRTTG